MRSCCRWSARLGTGCGQEAVAVALSRKLSQRHHKQQPRHIHRRQPHLGLLHGVEIEVEALEVYEEMVRERLDGAPLFGVQGHRLALACSHFGTDDWWGRAAGGIVS